LLKNGKDKEAWILFQTLFEKYPKGSQTLLFCIGTIFDNARDHEDFARNVVKSIKANFESVQVEIKRKKDKSGRGIGVHQNTVEIEIGSDEDNNIALWIKNSLES